MDTDSVQGLPNNVVKLNYHVAGHEHSGSDGYSSHEYSFEDSVAKGSAELKPMPQPVTSVALSPYRSQSS